MKKADFNKLVQNTPECFPRFRIKKVDDWLVRKGVKVGDEYYYHPNGCMVPITRQGPSLGTYASKYDFVDYIWVVRDKIIAQNVRFSMVP